MMLNHHRQGTGEPLLLIHGIGSRWQMWTPVLEALAAAHDVIAVDLPGFGASPMPAPGTPPGLASLTALVEGFLDEIGVGRPHAAGNSLGGLIALELARRDRVASATVLSPAGFASPTEMALARSSLWLSVRVARATARWSEGLLSRPAARRVWLRQVIEHGDRLSVQEAADSVRAMAAAPWFDETLPTLRPHQFGDGEQITVPVTVAWGEHDRLLLPRQARRAAVALPRARMVTLRGCGHVPTYDDPAQVARVVLEGARG